MYALVNYGSIIINIPVVAFSMDVAILSRIIIISYLPTNQKTTANAQSSPLETEKSLLQTPQ